MPLTPPFLSLSLPPTRGELLPSLNQKKHLVSANRAPVIELEDVSETGAVSVSVSTVVQIAGAVVVVMVVVAVQMADSSSFTPVPKSTGWCNL
jgi:hypothetical protein